MKRELRDELEVPGHVVMIKNMSVKDSIKRSNEIMDKWKKKGWNKPNDVPECKEKEEFRQLLINVGLKVEF